MEKYEPKNMKEVKEMENLKKSARTHRLLSWIFGLCVLVLATSYVAKFILSAKGVNVEVQGEQWFFGLTLGIGGYLLGERPKNE